MANDYFASKGWLTKYAQADDSRGAWQDYVKEVEDRDSRSMVQEPRNMYNQGSSVDHAIRTVNPEQDSFKKLSNVLGAYRKYRRGEKNPKLNFVVSSIMVILI